MNIYKIINYNQKKIWQKMNLNKKMEMKINFIKFKNLDWF